MQTHANEGFEMKPQVGGAPSVPAAAAAPAAVSRCLAVWVSVTALALGGTALGLDAVTDALGDQPWGTQRFDQLLVALAGAGATLLCPWLWLISSLTIADALAGRGRPGRGWIRRLTLAACGCAVTLAHVSAAHAGGAEPPVPTSESVAHVSVLSGLPFPERPVSGQVEVTRTDGPTTVAPSETRAPRAAPRAENGAGDRAEQPALRAPKSHPSRADLRVVQHGDTLWAIAADSLAAARPGPVTAIQTARAVVTLHEQNREVLGDDADLIRPGQRLDTTLDGEDQR